MKKIAIFIPAYNTAHTLPLTIERIPKEIKDKVEEIFVVDNDSKDNPHLVVIGYKEEQGLRNLKFIKNEKNLGYGGSQKKAYKYAIDKGYDIIVMLHGDGQYAPELLPTLLKPVEEGKADLVFGSRMTGDPLKGGMPFYRYLGNKGLTWIENSVLKLNLSEYHSGYRIYNCEALKKIPFDRCSDNYHFDTEILIQFRIQNLRIQEKPIPTYYGKECGSPSKWDLVVYSTNILLALKDYLLHKYKIKRLKKYEKI